MDVLLPRRWPLVGRTHERALLVDAFAERRWHGIVVAGGVGVGKTWLARAVLDELAADGHAVERLVGTRAAVGIPFGAVAPLLPPGAPGAGDGPAVADSMAAVRATVVERAGDGRLVVGVDDAHCLDDTSAAVILQLAVTTDAFLVVTTRTGEPTPDAIQVLWKDSLADRIELKPLPDDDVRHLLRAVLGGPVDEPCVVALTRASAGNCLYLRELVQAATEDGSLALVDGRWRLRRPPSPTARLAELVESRVGDLPEATRGVLDLVAAGEPLSLAALERVSDPVALEDADRRGFITVETTGRRSQVRLEHPLYGEVLRRRLTPLGWRRLCRTLADDLGATGMHRAEDVLRFVTWRLDAGLGAEVHLLLRATRRALEGNDLVAAERFADAALDAAGGGSSSERVRAALVWSDMSAKRLRFAAALTLLDALDGEHLTTAQTIEVTETRANLLFLDGRPDEAESLLEAGEHTVTTETARARLRIARARIVGGRGRPLEALALLDGVADQVAEAGLEAWDLQVRGPALSFAGRYDDAEAVAVRGLDPALAHAGEVTVAVDWVVAVLLMVTFGRGRLDEVEALVAPSFDAGLASGNRAQRRAAAASFGWARFERGDVNRTIELLHEGIVEDGGLESDGLAALAYAGLVGAYALAGQLDQARAALTQAETRSRPPVSWFEPMIAIGRALLAKQSGQPGEARRAVEEALDECAATGLRATEMFVASAACRVGAADLAARSLRRLVGEMQTPLPAVLLDHAEARLAGDPTRLLATGDGLERHGMVLAAAEAAAAAADLYDGAGQAREAGAARVTAHRRAERCPGADLGFLDGPALRVDLTVRELEVARLAAAGHSSAEIAARLYISVRTVDNHLGRAYIKLGVNGRDALARVIDRVAPR